MTLSRRLAALLSLLFLANLTLVSSGYACAMPASPSGLSAMAGMRGMAAPTPRGAVNAGVSDSDDDAPRPCQFPWAPDGCASMAPCAPSALIAPAHLFAGRPSAPTASVIPWSCGESGRVRAAPELPPPRRQG